MLCTLAYISISPRISNDTGTHAISRLPRKRKRKNICTTLREMHNLPLAMHLTNAHAFSMLNLDKQTDKCCDKCRISNEHAPNVIPALLNVPLLKYVGKRSADQIVFSKREMVYFVNKFSLQRPRPRGIFDTNVASIS